MYRLTERIAHFEEMEEWTNQIRNFSFYLLTQRTRAYTLMYKNLFIEGG